MSDSWVTVGWVHSTHPAKRQVRIKPESGCDALVESATFLTFETEDQHQYRSKIDTASIHSGLIIVGISPGTTRDTIALLRGSRVCMPADETMVKHTDNPPLSILIGMSAVDSMGSLLGRIVDAYEMPANDVIEILDLEERTVLVPFVPDAVDSVDVECRTIVIHNLSRYIPDDAY